MFYLANAFNELERMLDTEKEQDTKVFSRMNVNISETEDKYLLEADLPGVKKDNLDIKVEENLLVISVEKEEKEEKEEKTYLIREIFSSSKKRSFILPKDADKEQISADLSNGLLSVTIQKVEKKAPKKIDIKWN